MLNKVSINEEELEGTVKDKFLLVITVAPGIICI